MKPVITSIIGLPLVFGLLRLVLLVLVILPFRSVLRRSAIVMVVVLSLVTGISAYVSVAVIRGLSPRLNVDFSPSIIFIPICLIMIVFAIRLAAAVTPGGTDPAIHDSSWKPDEHRSDAWNLNRRVAIDQHCKAWSVIALGLGFGLAVDFWGVATLDPLWLRVIVFYIACGAVVTIFHLGFGDVGAAGLLVTVFLGLLMWPLFLVYRVSQIVSHRH